MTEHPSASSKERLILTAERLFAERGLGVSSRLVAAAAGNSNNSAVQYHFGSKDGLLQAIFEYRLPRLTERRRELLAERPADLRSSVDCQVRALLEDSERDDSRYASFVGMLLRHGRADVLRRAPAALLAEATAITDLQRAYLGHLEEPLGRRRLTHATYFTLYAAADRQQARHAGLPVPPFALELANLVDGIVGFLSAPASPEAREEAGRRDDPAPRVGPAPATVPQVHGEPAGRGER